MTWLRSILGLDSAEEIREAHRRIAKAKETIRAKRKRAAKIAAAVAFVAVSLGACKCPPGTAENAANVSAIVAENDAARAASTEPESVKAAQELRNREAMTLANKLAEACK